MNEIIVSVCVITYNHRDYIKQCLDGILMQKVDFPIEIIINDDCSTDGTAEIIQEYERNYPELFVATYQKENQYSKGVRGMFSRFCFPKARGKYIALCEGDDYWTEPLKLQKQVDFLDNNIECSMCFHAAEIIFSSEIAPVYYPSVEIENRIYSANEMLSKWTVPTASMLFRRDILTSSTLRSSDIINADIILVLMCCKSGEVRGMNQNMSAYRIHGMSLMNCAGYQSQRSLKYPTHLRYIKSQFSSIIDRRLINRMISESYWDIREQPLCWINRQLHKIRAFIYSPMNVVRKYSLLYRKKNSSILC